MALDENKACCFFEISALSSREKVRFRRLDWNYSRSGRTVDCTDMRWSRSTTSKASFGEKVREKTGAVHEERERLRAMRWKQRVANDGQFARALTR